MIAITMKSEKNQCCYFVDFSVQLLLSVKVCYYLCTLKLSFVKVIQYLLVAIQESN